MKFKNEILGGLCLWLAWVLMGRAPQPPSDGGNGGPPTQTWTCPYCGATFTSETSYNAHILTHQQLPSEILTEFEYDGQIFNSITLLDTYLHSIGKELYQAVTTGLYRGYMITGLTVYRPPNTNTAETVYWWRATWQGPGTRPGPRDFFVAYYSSIISVIDQLYGS